MILITLLVLSKGSCRCHPSNHLLSVLIFSRGRSRRLCPDIFSSTLNVSSTAQGVFENA